MTFGLSGAAIAGIAGGAIAAGGSMAAANSASGAARSASNSQTATTLQGMALQDQQFQRVQSLLSPYSQAATGTFDAASYLRNNPDVAADPYYGAHPEEHYRMHGQAEGRQGGMLTSGSLTAQQDLLGLNGADAQRSAVGGIENSPMFSSLVNQGENAMRQNASATGGLRGGNFQGALAQFRPAMLSAAIADQYSRLGGLTGIGQNAAAGVGNSGAQMANNNANLLGTLGSVQAGNALAQGRATAQGINGIAGGLGAALGAFGAGGGGGITTVSPPTSTFGVGYTPNQFSGSNGNLF